MPAPGWVLDTGAIFPGYDHRADNDKPTVRRELVYRIYATSVAGEGTTLLEESRGALTAPSWSPDGRSLAFGRVVTEGPGSSRFEVVLQDGPRQQRVITSRPLSDDEVLRGGFAGTMPAWSPDGRYLVVCGPPGAVGLNVIRADNGRILKSIEEAAWPSWSPDSTKLAYIATRVDPANKLVDPIGTPPEQMARARVQVGLYVLDDGFGTSRMVAELGQAFQTPVWSREGKSVIVASRKLRGPQRWPTSSRPVDLLRVDIASGAEENLFTMSSVDADHQKHFRSISFTLNRDGDDLFFATDVEGQRCEVFWCRPKTHEVLKRALPLDVSVRAGALAVSPAKNTLALRLGTPGATAPVGLWEVADNTLTPLVPDPHARVAWIGLLIDTARDLIRSTLPLIDGPIPARPTILPIRGEIPTNHQAYYGLRRIGRIGVPLCELPADAKPADPRLKAFLAEAKLFFDELAGNDAAALADLDALEDLTDSPDHRMRWLCLRTQLVIGTGDFDRAKDMVAFLKSAGSRRHSRVETTVAGVSVTEEIGDLERWSSTLAKTAENAEKSRGMRRPNRRDTALGHTNPDNPGRHDFESNPFGTAVPRAPMPGQFVVPADIQEIERRLGASPVPPIMPRFQRPPVPMPPR